MEITNVTQRTLKGLVSQIEMLKNQIMTLKNLSEEKSGKEWLDTQEVLFTLSISNRTLQSYRDSGLLPYTQVGSKMFYKPEDIHTLMTKVRFN